MPKIVKFLAIKLAKNSNTRAFTPSKYSAHCMALWNASRFQCPAASVLAVCTSPRKVFAFLITSFMIFQAQIQTLHSYRKKTKQTQKKKQKLESIYRFQTQLDGVRNFHYLLLLVSLYRLKHLLEAEGHFVLHAFLYHHQY